MSCNVSKSVLQGRIQCPANKSYTHRAAFIASLAEGGSIIRNALFSRDTESTIRACRNFGARVDVDGGYLRVLGRPAGIRPAEIDVDNSGTTMRMAAAVAGLCGGRSTITGDASIRRRPMGPLLAALESMGAKCESEGGRPPVSIRGVVTGGEISIPGNFSSQFASALLIAAPLMETGLVLNIDGDLVSKPYLDATIAVMRGFGARVREEKSYGRYHIPKQKYGGTEFVVPPDSSSLALLLCAAVLAGDGLIVGAERGSLPQGDDAFTTMLHEMGVETIRRDGEVGVVISGNLKGGSFDLHETPDLLPPLAVLALKADGPVEIHNVKHARLKETDRIKVMCRELRKTGLDVREKDDGMILERREKPVGAEFDPEGDHRLFMAFCIAGMYLGGCSVLDSESVAVSYPEFLDSLRAVGGRLDVRSTRSSR